MVLSLFKKKDKKEGLVKKDYFTLRIKDIIRETDDAITIIFDNPEEKINYKAGQFLTLILDVEGEKARRSYSLCSSPDVDDYLAVTVKKIDGGKVSNYINNELKPGDMVDIMKPMGHFTVEYNAKNERTFIVFAGGSGITPLISLIKSALHNEPGSKVVLVYQNRDEKSVILKKEIEKLTSLYGERLSVEHIFSKPGIDWKGPGGRLSDQHIEEIHQRYMSIADKVQVFMCGPEGMMDTIESTLNKLHFPKDRIHKESFTSSSSKSKEKTESVSEQVHSESKVTLILNEEEHEILVKPNDYILETALDNDIDMPFSCQSGLCTACRGKLISGQVTMDDPDGLSDTEMEEGYILTCVSHPVSNEIKIVIG